METYGFNPGQDFAPAYQAARAALSQRFLKQKGDLAQSLAARGVRTSGVSAIPTAQLLGSETEANAGIVGDFAKNQAEQGITDRRIVQQQGFERQMAQEAFDRQSSLQSMLARKQLQGQIIGGIAGAGGNAAAGYLTGYARRPTDGQ